MKIHKNLKIEGNDDELQFKSAKRLVTPLF